MTAPLHEAGACAGWRDRAKWDQRDCYACWKKRNAATLNYVRVKTGRPRVATVQRPITPAQREKVNRARVPCIHRGEQQPRNGRPCGCTIFACAIHGECSPTRNRLSLKVCYSCDEYQAPSP